MIWTPFDCLNRFYNLYDSYKHIVTLKSKRIIEAEVQNNWEVTLCVNMCVCVYICVRVHACVCVYIWMKVCMCAHVHVSVYVYVCTCVCLHMCSCAYTDIFETIKSRGVM